MKNLRISADIPPLPLDAVTQKLAWLGRTGSGKTFACKKLVELMLHAGAQVVILDGVGVWPGLRLGPKSFDIPVLGGLYGDIPLEPTAGALIADLIVDRGTSMVLDVSQMLDSERTRFATAFGQRFFQRKKAAPGAVHLVLEECQNFVPENQQSGEERMLHEFQRIAKQGRSFGIGVSFISQRPQEVSKKALNQAECVFAFQMTGPQERKALQYWLSDKGFEGKLADILPTLAVGAPHVWSPQWLKISKVIRILPIESLDTSQTPKVGEKAFAQKKLQPIDLTELSKAMADTIEKAKTEDPKALRARIKELESKLNAKTFEAPPVAPTALFDEAAFEQMVQEFGPFYEAFGRSIDKVVEELRVRAHAWAAGIPKVAEMYRVRVTKGGRIRSEPVRPTPVVRGPADPPAPRVVHRDPKPGNGETQKLGKCGRALLTVLIQRDGLRTTAVQLAILSGYSHTSSGFQNSLGALRSGGLALGSGDDVRVTPDGRREIPNVELLPSGAELRRYWEGKLGKCERTLLQTLAESHPKPLDKETLGERSGYSVTSSGFQNSLGKLRTLQLVSGNGDAIRMSEDLHG